MARLKHYVRSLGSGYLLLITNTLYALCSVPLALRYLADAEFGLWALVMQVIAYIALIDFGITAATSRILIDYKDKAEEFGSILRTTTIVNLTQAALALGVGSIAA